MHRQGIGRQPRLLGIIGVLLVLVVPLSVQGDFVFLKNGFTLRGKVIKEGTVYVDPASSQPIWMPKLGGFYLVDDGARRVVFSYHQVSAARPDPSTSRQEVIKVRPFPPRGKINQFVDTVLDEQIIANWDSTGKRTVSIQQVKPPRLQVVQSMVNLTPQVIQAGGDFINWDFGFLTNEFPPQTILTIARTALAKENKGKLLLEDHFKLFRFAVQAGWYDDAESILLALEQEFPNDKAKTEEPWKDLRQLQAKRRLDDVERAKQTGQHQAAQRLAASFPEQDVAAALTSRARAIREQYQEQETQQKTLRGFLNATLNQLKDPAMRPVFTEAVAEMDRELNHDTGGRLTAFLTMSRQEERLKQQGKPARNQPEELLALAVSGWVLGSNGAESHAETAKRLWLARQFVQEYLRTTNGGKREQLLTQYLKGESLPLDYFPQIIELLPPALPEKTWDNGPKELNTNPGGKGGIRYWTQLPPEYNPQRSYPLFFVLSELNEHPRDMLKRWSELAKRHGYLLVAPQWANGQATYEYSEAEHATVLDTLQDLRRRFNVDSNRVFLAGFQQSAGMAYDVGLSHPDLFAGVVVMGGKPEFFSRAYWPNAQYLPYYVIAGERGEIRSDKGVMPYSNRKQFEDWMMRGYACLYVEYAGRSNEFFHGELPYLFDWMERQKRPSELPRIGHGEQIGSGGTPLVSYRPTDSRFYWLTSDDLRIVAPPRERLFFTTPAKFSARITGTNKIQVDVYNLRQLSVWLNSRMVDLEQKVEIRVGNSVVNEIVKPSLKVLLEDYYARGDRENLFVARVDFGWNGNGLVRK